jgi:hypothetical protein
MWVTEPTLSRTSLTLYPSLDQENRGIISVSTDRGGAVVLSKPVKNQKDAAQPGAIARGTEAGTSVTNTRCLAWQLDGLQ